jgi:hypothetical protein
VSRNQASAPPQRVTRDDIQAKLRELQGEVDERTDAAKMPAAAVGLAAAVLAIVIAYWLGKRRGKKRQMVLEIRRI